MGNESGLAQALTHALVGALQMERARKQPDAARGLLRCAALNLRQGAEIAEGLREALPLGELNKASRFTGCAFASARRL